ncbi:MAG: LacI family DNA-binding transcriptional regulator [Chthoniobacteraceae bacterium]
MSRPTLRTIALAAKVSHCTVSRALRGDPRVSEKTRQIVQKLAAEMDYELNPYVASWMAHVRSTKKQIPTKGCLALLDYQTDKYFEASLKQIHGATERAKELGYNVEHISVFRERFKPERVKQILQTRAIQGILLPLSGRLSNIDMSFDAFAVVAMGHRIAAPPLHCTCFDHHTGVFTACNELSKLGYERIGLVLSEDHVSQLEWRITSAYLGWQNQAKKTAPIPPLVHQAVFQEKTVIDWCKRHRIDSLICINPETYRDILRKHFKLPGEIALACLDWDTQKIGIAGIDQQHEMIGSAAVDILVNMINHNVCGISTTQYVTMVEGFWRPGASAPGR